MVSRGRGRTTSTVTSKIGFCTHLTLRGGGVQGADVRVLISGAGIAGPALAWWLARFGVHAVVVERSPALRSGGHAIDIRGVAVDLIERMGLIEQVRSARTQLRMLSVVRRAGKPTLDIAIPRAQPGHRDLEIVRDDLARILYEATRDQVEYIFGDAIEQIENLSSEARVTFASGSTRSFDIVVGADGQHSATRRIAFGPEAAYTRRFGAYLSIFGTPNLLGLEDRAMLYNEPGRAIASYSVTGNQRAKVLFGLRSPRPFESLRDEPLQKRFLAEEFRNVGWEARRFVDALLTCEDFYFDEIAQIKMPCWWNGRVVLAGDAAHGPSPLSGQGTTLALVGAYVLADALLAHPKPSAAFCAYEQRMRPFVLPNQRVADSLGLRGILPGSTFAIGLRNLVVCALPLLTRLGVRADKQLQRLSRAIELPPERMVLNH